MDGDDLTTPLGADDGSDPGLDLDMLASSLHADGGDVKILLKALVTRLSDALGDRLHIEKAGGLLRRKSDEIRSVRIDLGNDQLEAAIDGGRVECTVARSSGGIRIRSEQVGIDEWIRRLLAAMRNEAATSQTTRLALESLVIGDS